MRVTVYPEASEVDQSVVSAQLGRPVRGDVRIGHRCQCGQPDVIVSDPRLPDGTPFPTVFYLTCPRLTAAVSTLESEGVMIELAESLNDDPWVAQAYADAHEDYLQRRSELGTVAEIDGISAGGMPDRVKCLHALVAHSLVAGPGINVVGDAAVALLESRWPNRLGCLPRTVAAVDCGTNSIRLLIARRDPSTGELRDVHREMRIVRLGEGIDETGVISEQALVRAFAACDEYAELITRAGAHALRFVATSASRDARNRADFVSGVAMRMGVEPEVISGAEEARLSYVGAVSTPAVQASAEPRLVVDIGGGSTEFVLGDRAPRASVSVDIGCVRLTERHALSDPPTKSEVAGLRADADAAIAQAGEVVDFDAAASLVGLAGTVTTIAALYLELTEYDPVVLHGARIPAAAVHDISERLAAMTLAERRALAVMHPGRADVIVSGSIILSRIVTATGLPEVVVSEHDILDGIVSDVIAGGGTVIADL